jgi:integrase
MVQEDFERLHKFLLETDGLSKVSDDMRQLVEHEWPELVDVEDYILQMAAAGNHRILCFHRTCLRRARHKLLPDSSWRTVAHTGGRSRISGPRWVRVVILPGVVISDIRFHDLQHAHATHLLASSIRRSPASGWATLASELPSTYIRM